MARFLALDGDTTRFQLLSANVKGDSVRLEQSLVWDEDQPINKNNAAAIGERLRAKLREAGIAPAPLLICLGRDRIIVKELKEVQKKYGDDRRTQIIEDTGEIKLEDLVSVEDVAITVTRNTVP